MPLVLPIQSIGRFFDVMGERGNRYTYDGAQFILDYYYDDPGYTQLDPISIVAMFKEYYCLRDYCDEVYNGDADLVAAAEEYVDLDDELVNVLAKAPDVQLKASILQASHYRKDILDALENNREFSTQKNYDGTPHMLANGSIMFVCA